MAKSILKYTLFVASPSDLQEERQAVDEIVQELNLGYGNHNNLMIEVLKWETHSAPGISNFHSQDIINQDIGNEYDLFLGLLWKKFGTKTKSADSGTEEEFLLAYNRFMEGKENFQILFYFKTAPPKTMNDINWKDLQKIEEFKNSISEKNVLYWEFDTAEKLKSLLRLHIPIRIESITRNKITIVETESVVLTNPIEEELGYNDYAEIVESSAAIAFKSLEKITEDTVWIGEKMNEKADEITRISKLANPNPLIIKEIFKRTALLMNDYSSRINTETPILYSNFEDVIKASSNLINLADDFYQEKTIAYLEDARETIFQMIVGINGSINGMTAFFHSVNNLPRIQKEIITAKKDLSQNIEYLIEKLKQSKSLAEEYKIAIVNKIDKLKIERNQ